MEYRSFDHVAVAIAPRSASRENCDCPRATGLRDWVGFGEIDRQASTTGELSAQMRALRTFFGRRVASPAEAEDMAQEVFVRLSASETGDEIRHPKAYLFRIARNLLIDRSRSRVRPLDVAQPLDSESEILHIKPDQENAVHLEDLRRVVETALSELPLKCRDAFILRRYHDLPTSQVATTLGISTRMVQKYLVQALTLIEARVWASREIED